MTAPLGHQVDVASCMVHMAEDMELKMWLDRSVGDDNWVHHHHFGGEVAHEQVLGLQDRSEGNKLPGRLVLEAQEHTGQRNLVETQLDR
jgi:hypothetical protein